MFLYTGEYNQDTGKYELNVDDSLATGYYTVKAGIENFIECRQEIFYYDQRLVESIDALNKAPAEEIGAYLKANADIFGIDITPYEALAESSVLEQVDERIAAEDFTIDPDNIANSLEEKTKLLVETYIQYIKPAYMFGCTDPAALRKFAEQYALDQVMGDDAVFDTISDFDTFYTYLIKVRQL